MSLFVIGRASLSCFEIIGLLKTRTSYIGAEKYFSQNSGGTFQTNPVEDRFYVITTLHINASSSFHVGADGCVKCRLSSFLRRF